MKNRRYYILTDHTNNYDIMVFTKWYIFDGKRGRALALRSQAAWQTWQNLETYKLSEYVHTEISPAEAAAILLNADR